MNRIFTALVCAFLLAGAPAANAAIMDRQYGGTLRELDLGVAPVTPGKPLPDWIPLDTAPDIQIGFQMVAVRPLQTMDMLIQKQGMRADIQSRLLVRIINSGLPESAVLHPGDTLIMPKLLRSADPNSPFAGNKPVAIMIGLTTRRETRDKVEQLSRIIEQLNAANLRPDLPEADRKQLAAEVKKLVQQYKAASSGLQGLSPLAVNALNATFKEAVDTTMQALATPPGNKLADVRDDVRAQQKAVAEALPASPQADTAYRTILVDVDAPRGGGSVCEIIVGLPIFVRSGAKSSRKPLMPKRPIPLLYSNVVVALVRGTEFDEESKHPLARSDIESANPLPVTLYSNKPCRP